MQLRRFQKDFVDAVLKPGITRGCLSIPRGNGKSWLAGYLAAESLRPGGLLWESGAENVLLSGSFDQARYVFRFAKEFLGETDYKYLDSTAKLTIRHAATGTSLLVRSSRAKGAFGIVGARLAIADEPGSFDTINGELMNSALDTAIGKPSTNLKVIYIGTLAPSRAGWWHDLIQGGSGGSTYVQSLQGDIRRWDQWSEIRRCNPLVEISSQFRKVLLEERDEARRDPRLKARFCSYRLNRPSMDESTTLLTVETWERVLARPVPGRVGETNRRLGSWPRSRVFCGLWRLAEWSRGSSRGRAGYSLVWAIKRSRDQCTGKWYVLNVSPTDGTCCTSPTAFAFPSRVSQIVGLVNERWGRMAADAL